MSQPHPYPPVDWLAPLVRRLAGITETLRGIGIITSATLALIMLRFNGALRAVRRLAGRIEAGTYKPRRSFTRRQPESPTTRDSVKTRPKFGWVAALLPDAAQYRGTLRGLLQQPETERLVQVAPAEMRRIFRPLCWALGMKPPPLLAIPRRPRPAPEPKKPAAADVVSVPVMPAQGLSCESRKGAASSPLPSREGDRGRGKNRENPGRSPLPLTPSRKGRGKKTLPRQKTT